MLGIDIFTAIITIIIIAVSIQNHFHNELDSQISLLKKNSLTLFFSKNVKIEASENPKAREVRIQAMLRAGTCITLQHFIYTLLIILNHI